MNTIRPGLAGHSRFVSRIRRRYETECALLPPGWPRREQQEALLQALLANGRSLSSALRVMRHLVIERLIVLDVECDGSMEDVVLCCTELAETALDHALRQASAELDARHGAPMREDGGRAEFWVIGMGKLGARELNVSSDIDLIYVYDEDGHTAGRPDGTGRVTNHEYFAQVAKQLYALVGDTTEDGFVFRVDLALRPNGKSGPPAISLAALEEYFLVQGREWERFAWLKSRVVAPRDSVLEGRALPMRDVVAPFVYRRYLDYNVFESLRDLHRRVREEAQRRAAGRPERANDVKLSRGGIREIEFTVQLLQVVRGGQFPELRTRSTLRALHKLSHFGLMKPETAEAMARAYEFYRRVEHRIQYLDDQQTHQLPTEDQDLRWIAQSLGFACDASRESCRLLSDLCEFREIVATEFDALLHEHQGGKPPCKSCTAPPNLEDEAFLARLPEGLATRVGPWLSSARVQGLREDGKRRLGKLLLRVGAAIEHEDLPVEAGLRFVDWLEPLLRRDAYLALLSERPSVLARLLRLLGLARWPNRYLLRYPGVIDELADVRLIHTRFDAKEYFDDLETRHMGWVQAGEADEESMMDTLRRAHHAEIFRTLVRDLEGHITVEEVADDLSLLADATLDCVLRWSWALMKQAHREQPRFAVIAYGKLGGKELGYGSDLDVVFLFDDDDERAPEVYAAFARRLITWLTLRTAAGELFEIDTALRPNGNSGLLVTSLKAFDDYQTRRSSNSAWTWEHQAITRARWCAGHPDLLEGFESVRRQVLTAERDLQALADEITGMRAKVRAAQRVREGVFDVKHGEGGMMDIEFVVQFLVLAHSASHPALQENKGNIALLLRAEEAGLLPAGVGQQAGDAYRHWRKVQHRARLDEQPVELPDAVAEPHRQAGLTLWRHVFGGGA